MFLTSLELGIIDSLPPSAAVEAAADRSFQNGINVYEIMPEMLMLLADRRQFRFSPPEVFDGAIEYDGDYFKSTIFIGEWKTCSEPSKLDENDIADAMMEICLVANSFYHDGFLGKEVDSESGVTITLNFPLGVFVRVQDSSVQIGGYKSSRMAGLCQLLKNKGSVELKGFYQKKDGCKRNIKKKLVFTWRRARFVEERGGESSVEKEEKGSSSIALANPEKQVIVQSSTTFVSKKEATSIEEPIEEPTTASSVTPANVLLERQIADDNAQRSVIRKNQRHGGRAVRVVPEALVADRQQVDAVPSAKDDDDSADKLTKKQRRKLNMEVRATELKVHKDRVDAVEKKRASMRTFCVPKTPEPEETSTEKKKSRTRKKITTEPVYGPPTKNEAHAMELQRGLWAAVLKKS